MHIQLSQLRIQVRGVADESRVAVCLNIVPQGLGVTQSKPLLSASPAPGSSSPRLARVHVTSSSPIAAAPSSSGRVTASPRASSKAFIPVESIVVVSIQRTGPPGFWRSLRGSRISPSCKGSKTSHWCELGLRPFSDMAFIELVLLWCHP